MKVTIEARTDVGRVRELNEDSYRIVADRNVVVVCDGMGGHAAGEIASSAAADTISDLVLVRPAGVADPIFPRLDGPFPEEGVFLAGAVRVANRRLYNAAARSNKLRGMGTTVIAAVFSDGVVSIVHVGDSRAYRIGKAGIEQLTVDHSWIAELVQSGQVKPEEAENFADKNVITRALGTRPNVQVDLGVHPVKDGDIYLLCSDGVCGYVSDEQILQIVSRHSGDLPAAAAGLIAAANAAGGLDNSTVALVRIESDGTGGDAYSAATLTLPEESDDELATLDQIIQDRYPEDGQAGPVIQAAQVTAPPPVPDEVKGEDLDEDEDTESGRAPGSGWAWAVVALVLLAVGAVLLWPGLRSSAPPATPESEAVPVPAQTERVPDRAPPVQRQPRVESKPQSGTPPQKAAETAPPAEGIVYLVAFGEARETGVYWDGVYQGRVSELEVGMIVAPGDHRLLVVSAAGDTVMQRTVTIRPNDTLDIEVK